MVCVQYVCMYVCILPGYETGVVKHICGNESSYLMRPQLQSDGTVLDPPTMSKPHEGGPKGL